MCNFNAIWCCAHSCWNCRCCQHRRSSCICPMIGENVRMRKCGVVQRNRCPASISFNQLNDNTSGNLMSLSIDASCRTLPYDEPMCSEGCPIKCTTNKSDQDNNSKVCSPLPLEASSIKCSNKSDQLCNSTASACQPCQASSIRSSNKSDQNNNSKASAYLPCQASCMRSANKSYQDNNSKACSSLPLEESSIRCSNKSDQVCNSRASAIPPCKASCKRSLNKSDQVCNSRASAFPPCQASCKRSSNKSDQVCNSRASALPPCKACCMRSYQDNNKSYQENSKASILQMSTGYGESKSLYPRDGTKASGPTKLKQQNCCKCKRFASVSEKPGNLSEIQKLEKYNYGETAEGIFNYCKQWTKEQKALINKLISCAFQSSSEKFSNLRNKPGERKEAKVQHNYCKSLSKIIEESSNSGKDKGNKALEKVKLKSKSKKKIKIQDQKALEPFPSPVENTDIWFECNVPIRVSIPTSICLGNPWDLLLQAGLSQGFSKNTNNLKALTAPSNKEDLIKVGHSIPPTDSDSSESHRKLCITVRPLAYGPRMSPPAEPLVQAPVEPNAQKLVPKKRPGKSKLNLPKNQYCICSVNQAYKSEDSWNQSYQSSLSPNMSSASNPSQNTSSSFLEFRKCKTNDIRPHPQSCVNFIENPNNRRTANQPRKPLSSAQYIISHDSKAPQRKPLYSAQSLINSDSKAPPRKPLYSAQSIINSDSKVPPRKPLYSGQSIISSDSKASQRKSFNSAQPIISHDSKARERKPPNSAQSIINHDSKAPSRQKSISQQTYCINTCNCGCQTQLNNRDESAYELAESIITCKSNGSLSQSGFSSQIQPDTETTNKKCVGCQFNAKFDNSKTSSALKGGIDQLRSIPQNKVKTNCECSSIESSTCRSESEINYETISMFGQFGNYRPATVFVDKSTNVRAVDRRNLKTDKVDNSTTYLKAISHDLIATLLAPVINTNERLIELLQNSDNKEANNNPRYDGRVGNPKVMSTKDVIRLPVLTGNKSHIANMQHAVSPPPSAGYISALPEEGFRVNQDNYYENRNPFSDDCLKESSLQAREYADKNPMENVKSTPLTYLNDSFTKVYEHSDKTNCGTFVRNHNYCDFNKSTSNCEDIEDGEVQAKDLKLCVIRQDSCDCPHFIEEFNVMAFSQSFSKHPLQKGGQDNFASKSKSRLERGGLENLHSINDDNCNGVLNALKTFCHQRSHCCRDGSRTPTVLVPFQLGSCRNGNMVGMCKPDEWRELKFPCDDICQYQSCCRARCRTPRASNSKVNKDFSQSKCRSVRKEPVVPLNSQRNKSKLCESSSRNDARSVDTQCECVRFKSPSQSKVKPKSFLRSNSKSRRSNSPKRTRSNESKRSSRCKVESRASLKARSSGSPKPRYLCNDMINCKSRCCNSPGESSRRLSRSKDANSSEYPSQRCISTDMRSPHISMYPFDRPHCSKLQGETGHKPLNTLNCSSNNRSKRYLNCLESRGESRTRGISDRCNCPNPWSSSIDTRRSDRRYKDRTQSKIFERCDQLHEESKINYYSIPKPQSCICTRRPYNNQIQSKESMRSRDFKQCNPRKKVRSNRSRHSRRRKSSNSVMSSSPSCKSSCTSSRSLKRKDNASNQVCCCARNKRKQTSGCKSQSNFPQKKIVMLMKPRRLRDPSKADVRCTKKVSGLQYSDVLGRKSTTTVEREKSLLQGCLKRTENCPKSVNPQGQSLREQQREREPQQFQQNEKCCYCCCVLLQNLQQQHKMQQLHAQQQQFNQQSHQQQMQPPQQTTCMGQPMQMEQQYMQPRQQHVQIGQQQMQPPQQQYVELMDEKSQRQQLPQSRYQVQQKNGEQECNCHGKYFQNNPEKNTEQESLRNGISSPDYTRNPAPVPAVLTVPIAVEPQQSLPCCSCQAGYQYNNNIQGLPDDFYEKTLLKYGIQRMPGDSFQPRANGAVSCLPSGPHEPMNSVNCAPYYSCPCNCFPLQLPQDQPPPQEQQSPQQQQFYSGYSNA